MDKKKLNPNAFSEVFESTLNPQRTATVVFELPIEQDTGEWSCSFEIIGLENEISETVNGVDGFQAILLTLYRIHSIFERQDDAYNCNGVPLKMIFPHYVPVHYGEKFISDISDIVHKKINDEEKKLYEKYSKKYPDYPKNFKDD